MERKISLGCFTRLFQGSFLRVDIEFQQPLRFYSGIFFVLPCIETYQKVDLRTITLGVPPQEVPDRERLKTRTFF